jgi:hypothetical protein
MGLAFSMAPRAPSVPEMLYAAFAFPMLFLFTGSVVVAAAWNRRADPQRIRARGRE